MTRAVWFAFGRCGAVALLCLATLVIGHAQPAAAGGRPAVMPEPAMMRVGDGRFAITRELRTSLRGAAADARVQAAATRMLRRWAARTGWAFAPVATDADSAAKNAPPAGLVVTCAEAAPPIPALGEDESYAIEISPVGVVLHSHTTTGALRGIATLEQLLAGDGDGWYLPAVSIRDQPRFPWRGLLIDVCRHWQSLDVIERNLDGMALLKLNVLHLHLTDDQGFRIESKRYPRLQQLASDGHYFTQAQMRELIAYAAARAIRVVPEFDVPGHATSWVTAYPELAAAPGPYQLQRRWGVFDPVLDPTNEQVYALLDGFFGEMADVFPDAYVHIGGDENNGVQWSQNPRIQAFIRAHGLKDKAGLHAYFNARVHALLARRGRKLMGWEEILHPGLPADSVVQSWRGANSLAAAARQGYGVVLSKGYYIDLMQPVAAHYRVDPDDGREGLTSEERRHILGGEATMWSEWVSPETIDSRIWPRTAAIAERLWSPARVTDIADLYRRLPIITRRLNETGLWVTQHQDAMLRRFAGDRIPAVAWCDLKTMAGVLEPSPIGRRRRLQPGNTQMTPLTGLVDCISTDSVAAREFAADVNQYLFGGASAAKDREAKLRTLLARWEQAGLGLTAARAELPRWSELAPAAEALIDVSRIGQLALVALSTRHPVPAATRLEQLAALGRAGQLPLPVDLALVRPVRRLVEATAEPDRPAAMAPDARRARMENQAQRESHVGNKDSQ